MLIVTAYAFVGISLGLGAKSFLGTPRASSPATTLKSSRILTAGSHVTSHQISRILADANSSQVTRALDLIDGFQNRSECLQFATRLLNDPESKDSETLWCILFARWSKIDPEGMIDFSKGQPESKLHLLAWETWGATDPDLLASKVISMRSPVSRSVLKGIASQDPDLALETAFKTPNVNDLIWSLFRDSGGFDKDLVREQLKRAVYDGMREPLAEHLANQLAENDPKEALSFIQNKGRNWSDPVAKMFAKLAAKNPEEAVSLLAAQPDSRSKAISAVQIAKVWAL